MGGGYIRGFPNKHNGFKYLFGICTRVGRSGKKRLLKKRKHLLVL